MELAVGIIGTGWVAERHVAALAKIEGARIAAIAGRNVAARERLQAMSGARGYAEWTSLLEKEALDALFILLPPHLRGEIEIAAAGRVPALLIEKPVALDLATARRVDEELRRRGTFAVAAYMNRCRPTVEKARELIAAGGGPPILVSGRWIGEVPNPAWWRDKSRSGGQFVEQCTHLVDLSRFLIGEVAEVTAFATRGFIDDLPDFAVDDALAVNLRFDSGALGSFVTGCFGRESLYEGSGISLEFLGREFSLRLDGWNMDLRAEGLAGTGKRVAESFASEEDIFEKEDRLFLRAAGEGRPELFPSSYADGAKTLAVTLAAEESASTGRSVRPTLDLRPLAG